MGRRVVSLFKTRIEVSALFNVFKRIGRAHTHLVREDT